MAKAPTSNVDAPNYRTEAYTRMDQMWTICQDVKENTLRIREKASIYLPRFEAEHPKDHIARVNMTFANDFYAQTLSDLAGLIHSKAPKLVGGDKDIVEWAQNVDGKGTAFEVFAKRLTLAALDYGHAGILTDFPALPDGQRVTKAQARTQKIKPYWTIIVAYEAVNWRVTKVGGHDALVQITIEECTLVPSGKFGLKEQKQYRVFTQALITTQNPKTLEEVPVSLGAITWELWREDKTRAGKENGGWSVVDEGTIQGPDAIPLRFMYGGEYLDELESKPFLYQLALTSLEETQVKSDYAVVMHKCNVPTPVFSGLGDKDVVKMGQGIKLPPGATATMLEPTGVALKHTRERIGDIQTQLRRQGAATGDGDKKQMTAEEARLIMRQRNARLSDSARSLKDCLGNALGDVAQFMGKPRSAAPAVEVVEDFSTIELDPTYLALVYQEVKDGLLPPDAGLYAMKHGRLPEEFNVEEEGLKALSRMAAVRDALTAQKERSALDQGDE